MRTLARVDTVGQDWYDHRRNHVRERVSLTEFLKMSTDAEVDAGLAEITESTELTEMDTESDRQKYRRPEVHPIQK